MIFCTVIVSFLRELALEKQRPTLGEEHRPETPCFWATLNQPPLEALATHPQGLLPSNWVWHTKWNPLDAGSADLSTPFSVISLSTTCTPATENYAIISEHSSAVCLFSLQSTLPLCLPGIPLLPSKVLLEHLLLTDALTRKIYGPTYDFLMMVSTYLCAGQNVGSAKMFGTGQNVTFYLIV